MIFLSEEVDKIEVGDIVILDKSKSRFKTKLATDLVNKNHMFLVLDRNPITICPISSNMNKVSKRYPDNVEILNWKDANLRKPSYAGIDVRGVIGQKEVYKIVGRISNKDKWRILNTYASGRRRLKIENNSIK